ncbi:hypothetical protein P6U16_23165 (plasmid) [Rhizobium sp. 32-5/1]|uniref:hypothetical protein n=1 Tax=Rhizobium sp. 32-5/1 TaxID=3019602 RepID=UPI00240D2928|nr:hypothetical protein [Rhizobium sp. 32-5/1]WEZ85892.1 hypothetical protein P6U16_23165 [Rhizobium sp. 32-5/1]
MAAFSLAAVKGTLGLAARVSGKREKSHGFRISKCLIDDPHQIVELQEALDYPVLDLSQSGRLNSSRRN